MNETYNRMCYKVRRNVKKTLWSESSGTMRATPTPYETRFYASQHQPVSPIWTWATWTAELINSKRMKIMDLKWYMRSLGSVQHQPQPFVIAFWLSTCPQHCGWAKVSADRRIIDIWMGYTSWYRERELAGWVLVINGGRHVQHVSAYIIRAIDDFYLYVFRFLIDLRESQS